MQKIVNFIFLRCVDIAVVMLDVIGWFQKKRPEVLEDPEWVMKATDHEVTKARWTGNYPPHPPGRHVQRLSDEQIRLLAQKIVAEARRGK
ncbi:hypothetical protein [Spirosoma validum]|uniref:Uncharacterized protein n=1 Tax=Spirosoma validum TaxID=2771355 RepID=A0A927B1L8_9BACT|nr:hypothetical protein [Spirosoma validum]MBD2753735.1 hypothetical protein [Spirosoma validum]